MDIPKQIVSKRLVLKPVSEEWADKAWVEFSPEITRYMSPPPAEKIEDTLDFIKSAKAKNKKGTDYFVYVFDKNSDEFLGGAGLHKLKTRAPELGIWLKKGAHGNKYGREAVTALAHWARENLDYDYMVYPCDKDNIGSCKIAESLGGVVFKRDEEINGSGNLLHIVYYKIQ